MDYVSLSGHHSDVVKEFAVVGAGVIQTFHFKSPYFLPDHGFVENGINWEDGNISYTLLPTVLSEAVAVYAHLYSYGDFKCKFLSSLSNRTFLNLEDLKCPKPQDVSPLPNFPAGSLAVSFRLSLAHQVTPILCTNGYYIISRQCMSNVTQISPGIPPRLLQCYRHHKTSTYLQKDGVKEACVVVSYCCKGNEDANKKRSGAPVETAAAVIVPPPPLFESPAPASLLH